MKSDRVCGLISLIAYWTTFALAGVTNRIINGNPARNGQFPWHATIIGYSTSGKRFLCGGSLIAPDWVLTAGHCVVGMTSLDLGFGSTELLEPQYAFKNITEYVIHPSYDQSMKHHDLALIRLPQRIEESDTVKIIPLPRTAADISYKSALGMICGYGRHNNQNKDMSWRLRWTRVKVIENSACQRVYGRKVVVDSTMCAVSVYRAGQNTCSGDSGGALVFREDGGVFRQIGVISFAVIDQCGAGIPSGFMRVRPNLQWIHSVILN